MAKCLFCGKKSLFLLIDKNGRCTDCQIAFEEAEQKRKEEEERVRREKIESAKEFILEFAVHVKSAMEHTVILPSFGNRAISEQRAECSYVLNHIDDWKEIEFFSEAFEETLVKSERNSVYESPIFSYYTIWPDHYDLPALFERLKKEVKQIEKDCLLAEWKAYDYERCFRVVGVTFKNGRRSRQTILREIYFKDPPYRKDPDITLRRYEFDGEDAVGVYTNDEQVGNISKTDLPWLFEHWDDLYEVSEFSLSGNSKSNFGMEIKVCFRNKEEEFKWH